MAAENFDQFRVILDESYHGRYIHQRHRIQDSIISRVINGESNFFQTDSVDDSVHWVIFLAGAMGCGKSFVREWLQNKHLMGINNAPVSVDIDYIRECLPESVCFKERCPDEFGQRTQKEAGYIAELCTHAVLSKRQNVIIDGSMSNIKWQSYYIQRLKGLYPDVQIMLVHVTAPTEVIRRRLREREGHTGVRIIPEHISEASLKVRCIFIIFNKNTFMAVVFNEENC